MRTDSQIGTDSLNALIRHLPGIANIVIEDQTATICYKSGLTKQLTSDAPEGPLWLLSEFLVPVQYSGEFKSILDLNRALDGMLEATDSIDTGLSSLQAATANIDAASANVEAATANADAVTANINDVAA